MSKEDAEETVIWTTSIIFHPEESCYDQHVGPSFDHSPSVEELKEAYADVIRDCKETEDEEQFGDGVGSFEEECLTGVDGEYLTIGWAGCPYAQVNVLKTGPLRLEEL